MKSYRLLAAFGLAIATSPALAQVAPTCEPGSRLFESPLLVELSRQPGYFFDVSLENLATVDADVLILLDEGGPEADALYE
jgi:hypothetical protein